MYDVFLGELREKDNGGGGGGQTYTFASPLSLSDDIVSLRYDTTVLEIKNNQLSFKEVVYSDINELELLLSGGVTSDGQYSLSPATTEKLGTIKLNDGMTTDGDGAITQLDCGTF